VAASAILLVDVDVASDGPAALELSRRHLYGLALLDYKIYKMQMLMGPRNGRGES
jgi:hypothetical protein